MTATYTLPTTKERLLMERQLIGRSINCIPSALTIADVLTPANFRDPLCQKIYPLILEGVETQQLGIVPLTRKYFQKYGENNAHEITDLYSRAEPSPSILELALNLLEDDMREQFLRLLTRMERECAKAANFEEAAVWKQSADHMADRTNDVFQSIDHLHAYLSACFPDQMDEYNTIRSAVPKLIDRIKTRKKTRKFMDTLYLLAGAELTPDQNKTIRILGDWTILTMSGMKVPEKFHETIHQLNLTWNE